MSAERSRPDLELPEKKTPASKAGQATPELRPPESSGNVSKAEESDVRDAQEKEQALAVSLSETKPWPHMRDDSDYDGFIFGPFLPTPTQGLPLKGSNSTTSQKT
jgi:hypothetical protein